MADVVKAGLHRLLATVTDVNIDAVTERRARCMAASLGLAAAAAAESGPTKNDGKDFTRPRLVPPGALDRYIARFMSITRAPAEATIVALIYIERSGIKVTWETVHRLVLAAMTLACKWRSDRCGYHRNDMYAFAGGVSVRELWALEREMLRCLDWRLVVSLEEFEATRRGVESIDTDAVAARADTAGWIVRPFQTKECLRDTARLILSLTNLGTRC